MTIKESNIGSRVDGCGIRVEELEKRCGNRDEGARFRNKGERVMVEK